MFNRRLRNQIQLRLALLIDIQTPTRADILTRVDILGHQTFEIASASMREAQVSSQVFQCVSISMAEVDTRTI